MLVSSLRLLGQGIVSTVTDKTLLNRLSPLCYIFAISGIAGWGVFVAIPFLYSDFPSWMETCALGLGYFLAIELVVNWLCMLLVDTSFRSLSRGCSNMVKTDKSNHNCNMHQNSTHDNDIYCEVSEKKLHTKHPSDMVKIPRDRSILHQTENHGLADDSDFISACDGIAGTIQPNSTRTYGHWQYCVKCDIHSPPRCHHCGLCNKCILKRDHHCFVVARCIGYRNLRHFSVFVFYASLATLFAMVHALPYAFTTVIPKVAYPDLFYPVAIGRGIFGFIDFVDMILIVLGWMVLGYLIFSTYTLTRVFKLVTTGRTTFEVGNGLPVVDERDIPGRLRGIYGRHWWWNFVIPMHFIYEPIDDPFTWPHLKYNGQYIS